MKRLKNFWPYFLIIALASVFWRRILWGGETLFYDNILRLFYPYLNFFSESLRGGEFPVWNPYLYGGLPFIGVMQSAVFYPASYLFVFMDFARALSLSTALHTALAGIFMYVLARRWRLNSWGAFGAGMIFMLNGFFIYHAVFLPQFAAYIWLPLIAGFSWRALTQADARAAGMAALCLTLQFFSGHPQFSFYSLTAFAALAVVLSVKGEIPRRRAALVLGSIFILFALLSAIQWMPTRELAALSARGAGLSLEAAAEYSMSPRELIKSLFGLQWNRNPEFLQGDIHIKAFYVGLPVLLLAARGFWRRRKSTLGIWLGALLGGSILLALGEHLPGYEFIHRLWPFFRFPAQWLYLSAFSLALLAGAGLGDLRIKAPRKLLIMAAILVDLFMFSSRAHSFVSDSFFKAASPTAEFLKNDESVFRILMTPETRAALGQGGRSFEDAWLRFKDSLFPNIAMAYGIPDADGYEELRLARYERVLEVFKRRPHPAWLKILNIKYLLSFQELSGAEFKTEFKGSVRVSRYLNLAPRAFFVPNARLLAPEAIFEEITNKDFDPFKEILIEPPFALPPDINALAGAGKNGEAVEMRSYSPSRVHLRVSASEPGFVLLTDSYFPGWEALVNGQKAQILPANYLFRAVVVPAGESNIIFEYSAPALKRGIGLSILGLLMLAFIVKPPSFLKRLLKSQIFGVTMK